MTCQKHAQVDEMTTARTKTGIKDDEEEARNEKHLRARHPADIEREAETGSAARGDTKVRMKRIVLDGNAKDQDHPTNGLIDTKGATLTMIGGRAEGTAKTVDIGGADHTLPQPR